MKIILLIKNRLKKGKGLDRCKQLVTTDFFGISFIFESVEFDYLFSLRTNISVDNKIHNEYHLVQTEK